MFNMFKKKKGFIAVLLMVVMLLSQVAFAEEAAYLVEIGGPSVETVLKLTIDDLKAMPEEAQIEEAYIYNSKSGEKSVDVKGVSLAYLLNENAGIKAENAEVVLVASDGYQIDPQMLEDVLDEDLKYVLAYEIDGEKIDNDDNPDNDEIVVYRKVKEEGEFGTVFKLINEITVGEAIAPVEEEEEEPVEETPEEDVVFTDITEEYAFAETAIMELAKKGIINGIGEGLYAPEKELTREQFAKIIVESLGYEKSEYTGLFSDVEEDDWSADYIQTAVDKELFQGTPEGAFMPEKVITRQEMATVVGRAALVAEVEGSHKMEKFVMEKSDYLDKDEVPEWAENEVAWLEAQGVFEEIADENFQPTRVVNRAEAAVVVYNTLFK